MNELSLPDRARKSVSLCQLGDGPYLQGLTDGVELPLALVTVKLAEYQSGRAGIILGKIVDAKLLVFVSVHQTYEGISDHAEVLPAVGCLVYG